MSAPAGGTGDVSVRNATATITALSAAASRLIPVGTSNAAFVDTVFRNVVGAAPDAATSQLLRGLLDGGFYTQGQMAALAALTDFNQTSVGLSGLAQSGLGYS